ncbi:hypothetical protein [Sphingobium sp. ZW T5_29]|uniref:hyaluronate lyase N-terminal domain-containing protein n=1 Tax=Sphingobium sp. ZW T5_29 TaxID=3378077 RepID=UPI0038523A08
MPTVKFQLRRDTAANWASVNPTLGPGEPALETDTGKVKYGNGATAWNSLPYFAGDLGTALMAIKALTPAADRYVYFTSGSAAALGTITAFGRSLLDDADAATARGTLGLGTITTQAANNVAITGGSASGLTALGIVESGDNFTVDQYSNTSAVGANMLARRARGTSGSPTGVLSGNVLGGIYGAGWRDTAVWSNFTASVRAVAAEDFVGTANGTQLEFATTSIGASSRSTRFTISPAGSLYSNVTPSTTMTTGFVYIPAGAGVPTGVPEGVGTNQVAMYYDRTNNHFYIYNGAWKKVALA